MPYKDREKQLEAQRRYYRDNVDKQQILQRSKRNRVRKFIEDYKLVHPMCADCKIDYPPYILDFDHVRGEKVDNIARMAGKSTEALILLEIEKCDIVCSNCHRHRTWSRKQF